MFVCFYKFHIFALLHYHPIAQYYAFAFAVPGLDVGAGTKRLLLLCGIRGLVPGLALAITKLVVELESESITLLVASALVISEIIDGCVVSVCEESILSSVEDGPASVDEVEFEGEDEASIVDKSIPMPTPTPINILVLSSVS